jgi:hypothetical protein
MLVDRDIIRKLIVPRQKTNAKAVVLPVVTYDKIKKNSQVRNCMLTHETKVVRDASKKLN